MSKSKITIRDLGYSRIMKEIEKTGQTYITVGVHQEQAGGRTDDKANNALIASVHEFGTYSEISGPRMENGRLFSSGVHVPARPFLRTTIDNKAKAINAFRRKVHNEMIEGKKTAEEAAGLLALMVETEVKKTITKGMPDWPKLSPVTIAAKGSSKPLVDTGQLRASIRGVVHIGEKGGVG